MLRRHRFGAVLLVALVCAGCAHKPTTYRLIRLDRGQVVVPPEVVTPDLASRVFVANIPPGRGPCAVDSAAITLQPQKKKIRVTVNRDALVRQPAGWLADWSLHAESHGCVEKGSGQMLADRIVQSLPLDSAAAYRLLHADTIRAGYVELGPQNRLEVRSPIAAEGTPVFDISRISGTGNQLDVDLKGPTNTIGFETAWYALARNPGRPGQHFVPLSAERNVQGSIEHLPGPAINYFQFPADATFFRLFYKGDDNGIQSIVIAGATREELGRRTQAVATDTASCEKAQGMCLALPRRVGVNPFMVVSVNGREVTAPLRATVAIAIRSAGMKTPENVLATLSVTKPFGDRSAPVEFDRRSHEILSLQLMGGETISWQPAP